MRALITGADGFSGRWLSRHLEACGDEVIKATESDGFDLVAPDSVRRVVLGAQPDVIYHLAAQNLVGDSWKNPAYTFEVNAMGTLHLLDAGLACDVPPKVLLISSSEVYGDVESSDLPVGEPHRMAPKNPFAASKVAAEFLGLQAYLGTRLPVIRARAFSYLGPDQAEQFVAPTLAKRIIAAASSATTELVVGNLEASRDYLDIRDAVRAYRLLAEYGELGETYNICSGQLVTVRELAERLLDEANIDLDLVVDPTLVRTRGSSGVKGDPSRLKMATKWKPEIKLDQTLRDVLRFWRNQANPSLSGH